MQRKFTNEELRPYLEGKKLWGDDYDQTQIDAWFENEREAYADLGAGEGHDPTEFGYHELNKRQSFRFLPSKQRFDAVLGIGSSYGDEFLPIADRIGRLTISEPSLKLRSNSVAEVPVHYVTPQSSGELLLADASFDLVVCFATLHHIPNVTRSIQEIARVTKLGGFVCLREPVISMGDWTAPRAGLTANERGIPTQLFREAIDSTDLKTIHDGPCAFPLTRRLSRLGIGYSSQVGALVDDMLSRVTAWNYHYHAQTKWQKVQPSARAFVLQRSST